MSFCRLTVNLERLHRRFFCLRIGFIRRKDWAKSLHERVTVGQSGVRLGVIRVLGDRLIEIFDGFPKTRAGSLIPLITTLLISQMRLGIDFPAFGQSLPLTIDER